MSNLNIAERRLPQDGRIRMRVAGKDIDLRVSFLPTVHGEKCVLRILDKSNVSASIDGTHGFRQDDHALLGFERAQQP
jgi:type IV pilus assembly protein PilB